MRLSLPSSLALLARLHAGEELATTTAVEADDDSEDSEYAALLTAAEVSAELVGAGGRRVVVVAEVGRPGDPVTGREGVARWPRLPASPYVLDSVGSRS